ncbi:gamma-carboxygeranoyl-CoA hydratase [Shewanella sp. Choline-02u-19]|uniref:enoyl-CoA hydratase-related protein n=1 Tax=unclassified Shewanella TaxID=196818 RepID=UPI000C347D5C|nr:MULTISPECIES: enoyl-CoA hydratase-related protein [unclassified Shewanella]PKG58754.1 gamma-carboxygeranoyl-CoA hydratase [Shewanella sp. GutDb-MelDb]PKG74079.1 gamma-carboxygeranoyl-CoA hydratase [Shewanella sp. GutCb]PKH55810.1 gamma-carboxygeranoyl-CoA hydratase [Shewanella sp. Bg11-22]PKI29300.1 gamma-carboxygeranoyl-CoA hydratase [Shewanella sp. Choline-02u-19]
MTTERLAQQCQYVSCTLDNGVAELILDRPDKHNAFDEVMISEMIQVLEYFAHTPQCQVLVVKANGKNFSAGADLNWMRKQAKMDFAQNLSDANELAKLMSVLDKFPKPTIAKVQGVAFGGALGLICCCDIAIANPRASFCLSEVKLGLMPAVISPYVTRAMGQRAARRYMLTAERFNVQKAIELQVIHEVEDDLDAAAAPIIAALLSNSPQGMAWAKRLLSTLEDGVIDQTTLDYTSERIASIRVSIEAQEGLNAFFEKRSPDWSISQKDVLDNAATAPGAK